MLGLNALLRLLAGLFVVLSVVLAYVVTPWFLIFTFLVGVNLLQSGLTGWCPMMVLLRRLGVEAD